MTGKTYHAICDCYMEMSRSGEECPKEVLCVLNVSDKTADITITAYFADMEPITGFKAVCESGRINHISIQMLRNEIGETIPFEYPFALVVESDTPIIVQYSTRGHITGTYEL